MTTYQDAIETESSGQLRIGVAGEQRSLEGLAAPVKPAPLAFERDAVEQAAREQLEECARRRYRCAQCGRELSGRHWVHSRTTGARYCWPGEGCNR